MISKQFFSLLVIIAVISLLGFITENVWISITKGFMDNRNMYFPFLLGYGLAVAALFLLFGTPAHPRFLIYELAIENSIARSLYYLLMMALCVSIGEILLGTLVEKTCGIIWWNYTELPLHIGKYTSVPTSLGFATLITIFMRFCFEPLYNFCLTRSYHVVAILGSSLFILMLVDFFHSAWYMVKNKRLMQRWTIDTTGSRVYQYLHTR